MNGGPSPKGDVVGIYTDAANKTHGFLLTSKGVFTTIDYPGAVNTQEKPARIGADRRLSSKQPRVGGAPRQEGGVEHQLRDLRP